MRNLPASQTVLILASQSKKFHKKTMEKSTFKPSQANSKET